MVGRRESWEEVLGDMWLERIKNLFQIAHVSCHEVGNKRTVREGNTQGGAGRGSGPPNLGGDLGKLFLALFAASSASRSLNFLSLLCVYGFVGNLYPKMGAWRVRSCLVNCALRIHLKV